MHICISQTSVQKEVRLYRYIKTPTGVHCLLIIFVGCKLHVAFHGCEQTLADIGSDFVVSAGYNSWAEANNIIILYPQAADNLLNPKGCWDWYVEIFYYLILKFNAD